MASIWFVSAARVFEIAVGAIADEVESKPPARQDVGLVILYVLAIACTAWTWMIDDWAHHRETEVAGQEKLAGGVRVLGAVERGDRGDENRRSRWRSRRWPC